MLDKILYQDPGFDIGSCQAFLSNAYSLVHQQHFQPATLLLTPQNSQY